MILSRRLPEEVCHSLCSWNGISEAVCPRGRQPVLSNKANSEPVGRSTQAILSRAHSTPADQRKYIFQVIR